MSMSNDAWQWITAIEGAIIAAGIWFGGWRR